MKNDNVDIEKILKNFRGKPGETVRQTVMAEFDRELSSARTDRVSNRFWGKPVPAYAVFVLLSLFVTGAFLAGRQVAVTQNSLTVTEETIPGPEITSAKDIPWCTTVNDLL